MCPWVFAQLWKLQADIIDDNVIPNYIFGSDATSSGVTKYLEDCDDNQIIPLGTIDNGRTGQYIAIMTLRGFYQPYRNNSELLETDEWSAAKDALCSASSRPSINEMLSSEIYNAYGDVVLGVGGEYYVMEYKWGISTAVGVVVLLILVSFCMDVATRMVKLSFLQLITSSF